MSTSKYSVDKAATHVLHMSMALTYVDLDIDDRCAWLTWIDEVIVPDDGGSVIPDAGAQSRAKYNKSRAERCQPCGD